jgi:hypothetical protein
MPGQRAHVHRHRPQRLDDFVSTPGAGRRKSEQDVGYAKSLYRLRNIGRAKNANAIDVATDLSCVVIDEAKEFEFAAVGNGRCRLGTSRTRAVYQQAMPAVTPCPFGKPEPCPCA